MVELATRQIDRLKYTSVLPPSDSGRFQETVSVVFVGSPLTFWGLLGEAIDRKDTDM